ncbi:hypothetical protein EVAR_2346_1 [Eumeta japonica]|uniref:Uncharacterized protein n=1 Tax=Eumeta variegata TaxID=151549 RepID=A0A4C1SG09_EUMVA|nr:hypothetical protein EVAR_2346_1 [Eumeta japonica]
MLGNFEEARTKAPDNRDENASLGRSDAFGQSMERICQRIPQSITDSREDQEGATKMRSRGRPSATWWYTVEKDLKSQNISLLTIQDRMTWRKRTRRRASK